MINQPGRRWTGWAALSLNQLPTVTLLSSLKGGNAIEPVLNIPLIGVMAGCQLIDRPGPLLSAWAKMELPVRKDRHSNTSRMSTVKWMPTAMPSIVIDKRRMMMTRPTGWRAVQTRRPGLEMTSWPDWSSQLRELKQQNAG